MCVKDACADIALCCSQGGYKYHQYQVVGRHLPTEKEPEPTIYRMKLWATDPVRAKSKFWCAVTQFCVYVAFICSWSDSFSLHIT